MLIQKLISLFMGYLNPAIAVGQTCI
jgi:hypothetical protein